MRGALPARLVLDGTPADASAAKPGTPESRAPRRDPPTRIDARSLKGS
jgi:hypothetical protein